MAQDGYSNTKTLDSKVLITTCEPRAHSVPTSANYVQRTLSVDALGVFSVQLGVFTSDTAVSKRLDGDFDGGGDGGGDGGNGGGSVGCYRLLAHAPQPSLGARVVICHKPARHDEVPGVIYVWGHCRYVGANVGPVTD